MPGNPIPKDSAGGGQEKLDRDELLDLLRDVTEQRNNLLSQYEAMAFQVDESVREIATDLLDARENANKAEASEHRAEQEATHATELSRQLDEERRKKADIAAEFARFRDALERAPIEDPWIVLWRAVSQIVSNWVDLVRAKIPPDSRLLPWFDRAIKLAKTAGRLTLRWSKALFKWTKPRIIDGWKRLIARHRGKE